MKKNAVYAPKILLVGIIVLLTIGSSISCIDTPYTLSYNINGGDGTTPKKQRANAGSSIILTNDYGFSKDDFIFSGWNTMADGSGENFYAGDQLVLDMSTVVYAQWTPVLEVVFQYFLDTVFVVMDDEWEKLTNNPTGTLRVYLTGGELHCGNLLDNASATDIRRENGNELGYDDSWYQEWQISTILATDLWGMPPDRLHINTWSDLILNRIVIIENMIQ